MSLRSVVSSVTSANAISNLKMERNLLERMVQERDEKIASLQKNLELQTDHMNKLQAKMEIAERREMQVEQRHRLKLESVNHEKSVLKSQLKVMQEELRRIGDDPIHHALTSNASDKSMNGTGSSESPLTLLNNLPGGSRDEDRKVKLTNNAQGLLLQSQLFQAMNSLQQLRQQTGAMKTNYDEIVNSLTNDLVFATDEKASVEAELLSQLSLLEQEKKVLKKSLKEQLKKKDIRIQRLEKRIESLDLIDDDESYHTEHTETRSGDVDTKSHSGMSLIDDLRADFQNTNHRPEPKPYSTDGGSIFSNKDKSNDVATIMSSIRESQNRARALLRQASSKPTANTPLAAEG